MSIGAKCQTNIDDEDLLAESLIELLGKDKVSIVKEGAKISGYASDLRPTVLVNIPGLFGTAGFHKNNATGTYDLIYDSVDRRRLKRLMPQTVGNTVINELHQVYSKLKVKRALSGIRGRVTRETVEQETGRIKLKVRIQR